MGFFYIMGKRSFVSETYSIEDTAKYDSASSDKTSDYTKSNVTLTHNNNGYYVLTQTNDGGMAYCQLNNHTFSDCEISADVNVVSTGNNQFFIGLFDTANNVGYAGRYSKPDSRLMTVQLTSPTSGTTIDYSTVLSISNNVWYHCVVKISSNSLIVEIYDMNDTLIASRTESITTFNGGKLHIVKSPTRNQYIHIKNIKIKPL